MRLNEDYFDKVTIDEPELDIRDELDVDYPDEQHFEWLCVLYFGKDKSIFKKRAYKTAMKKMQLLMDNSQSIEKYSRCVARSSERSEINGTPCEKIGLEYGMGNNITFAFTPQFRTLKEILRFLYALTCIFWDFNEGKTLFSIVKLYGPDHWHDKTAPGLLQPSIELDKDCGITKLVEYFDENGKRSYLHPAPFKNFMRLGAWFLGRSVIDEIDQMFGHSTESEMFDTFQNRNRQYAQNCVYIAYAPGPDGIHQKGSGIAEISIFHRQEFTGESLRKTDDDHRLDGPDPIELFSMDITEPYKGNFQVADLYNLGEASRQLVYTLNENPQTLQEIRAYADGNYEDGYLCGLFPPVYYINSKGIPEVRLYLVAFGLECSCDYRINLTYKDVIRPFFGDTVTPEQWTEFAELRINNKWRVK